MAAADRNHADVVESDVRADVVVFCQIDTARRGEDGRTDGRMDRRTDGRTDALAASVKIDCIVLL